MKQETMKAKQEVTHTEPQTHGLDRGTGTKVG